MTRRPSAERRRTAKSCRRPSRRLHADTSGPVSQTISRRFETAPRRHGAKGQGRPRLHQHTEAPPGRARPTPRRAPRKMCASASPRGRAAWPGTRASKWCAGQRSWAEYEGRSMSESTLGLFRPSHSCHSAAFPFDTIARTSTRRMHVTVYHAPCASHADLIGRTRICPLISGWCMVQ